MYAKSHAGSRSATKVCRRPTKLAEDHTFGATMCDASGRELARRGSHRRGDQHARHAQASRVPTGLAEEKATSAASDMDSEHGLRLRSRQMKTRKDCCHSAHTAAEAASSRWRTVRRRRPARGDVAAALRGEHLVSAMAVTACVV